MTDEELKAFSDKVRMAIKLENPTVRFIAFFFAGDPKTDETLRSTCTASCAVTDQLAAIDSLLSNLEDQEGVDRNKLLGSIITHGPATISKEEF